MFSNNIYKLCYTSLQKSLIEIDYNLKFHPKGALHFRWRRGGLVVSGLISESSGLGSSLGWGNCVVFLDKTLYSHIASLFPGV